MLNRFIKRADTAIHDGVHPDDRAYYGRNVSPDYIDEQHYRWNTLPPRRMRFCERCGAEVRWFREGSVFDVGTGVPSHRYHLKCPNANRYEWEEARARETDPRIFEDNFPFERRFTIIDNWAHMHYDSHLYATVADDRESFANEELP